MMRPRRKRWSRKVRFLSSTAFIYRNAPAQAVVHHHDFNQCTSKLQCTLSSAESQRVLNLPSAMDRSGRNCHHIFGHFDFEQWMAAQGVYQHNVRARTAQLEIISSVGFLGPTLSEESEYQNRCNIMTTTCCDQVLIWKTNELTWRTRRHTHTHTLTYQRPLPLVWVLCFAVCSFPVVGTFRHCCVHATYIGRKHGYTIYVWHSM